MNNKVETAHSRMVNNLAKQGEDILKDLTPHTAELLHMAILLAGEAGELVDCIKKHAIYTKKLDFDNLEEELGDIEFSLERIRQLTGVTREETLEANIKKLAKRYDGSYSNESAQIRLDKIGA